MIKFLTADLIKKSPSGLRMNTTLFIQRFSINIQLIITAYDHYIEINKLLNFFSDLNKVDIFLPKICLMEIASLTLN